MAKVKICGITVGQDALDAVDLGVWGLGFMLYPGAERYCDPAVAAGIAQALQRRTQLVGVFKDQPLDELADAVEGIGLTHIQLDGSEGPAYCGEVHRRTGCQVIKTFRVESIADIRAEARFPTDFHLLDSPFQQADEPWDWTLISHRRSSVPLLISGALATENVNRALAASHAWGVNYRLRSPAGRAKGELERLVAAVSAFAAQSPSVTPNG